MHRQVDNSEAHAASMAKKEAKYGMKVAHLFKGGQELTLPHILSNRSDQSTFVSNSAPKLAKAAPVVVIGGMPKLQMVASPRSQQFQHIPRLVVAPAVSLPETETSEVATNTEIDKLLAQVSKLKQTVQLQKELLSDKSYQIQLMSQEISMMRLSNEKLAQTNSEAVAQAKAREKEHIEQNHTNQCFTNTHRMHLIIRTKD